MSKELPKGWCLTSLAGLGNWRGGGTPSKSDSSFWTDGSIPWVSPKDMKSDYILDAIDHITPNAVRDSATQLIDEGSILVVNRSGILERTLPIGINSVPVAINQDLKALTTDGMVIPELVASFLRASTPDILRNCSKRGTTVASVDVEKLKEFSFPLPPLPEQKRIVKTIEALQARSKRARVALESIPPLIQKFRQSVLASAFKGDLTKEWREKNQDKIEPASELLKRIRIERRAKWEEEQLRKFEAAGKAPRDRKWKEKYKEPEQVNTDGLPELPKGWCWAPVELLAQFVTDGDHQAPPQTPSGVPFIVISNVIHGSVDLSNTRFVSGDYFAALDDSKKPRFGDILYTVTGSFGIPVLVDTHQSFCFQRHIALFRSLSLFRSEWLLTSLSAPQVVQQATNVATGTAQKTVPLSALRRFAIPVPPLQEQHQILNAVSLVQQSLALVQNKLNNSTVQVRSLDQSILAKAFRGELVKQDPNDEPASVLLQRIKKEREEKELEANKGKGKTAKFMSSSQVVKSSQRPEAEARNGKKKQKAVELGM